MRIMIGYFATALLHTKRPERRRSRIKKSWNLVSLNCCENLLSSIDSSLRFCPKLVFLDLSNNNIPEIKRLQHCRDLQYLNISFNVLCDLRGITDNLLNIRSLVLKGNQISDTSGLEYCPTLTQLDLTANLIADPEACIALSSLPQLSELWLCANPISYSRQYNAWVRKLFGFRLNEGDFYLDGKKLTNRCRVLCCFRRRSKDAPSLTSYDTSSVGYSSRSMLLPKPSIGYRKPTKRTSKSSRRVVTIHDMNSSPSAAAKKFAESRSYIPPSPRSDSQTLTGCCVGAIRPHSRMEPAPRPHRTPRIPAAASRSQLSCVYSPVSSRAPSLPSHITPLSYSDGSPMSLSKSPGDRPLPMLTPEEVMVSQLFDEKSDSEASAGHAQHRVAEVATTVSDCQSDYDHQSPVYAHRSGRDIPVSHRLRSEQDTLSSSCHSVPVVGLYLSPKGPEGIAQSPGKLSGAVSDVRTIIRGSVQSQSGVMRKDNMKFAESSIPFEYKVFVDDDSEERLLSIDKLRITELHSNHGRILSQYLRSQIQRCDFRQTDQSCEVFIGDNESSVAHSVTYCVASLEDFLDLERTLQHVLAVDIHSSWLHSKSISLPCIPTPIPDSPRTPHTPHSLPALSSPLNPFVRKQFVRDRRGSTGSLSSCVIDEYVVDPEHGPISEEVHLSESETVEAVCVEEEAVFPIDTMAEAFWEKFMSGNIPFAFQRNYMLHLLRKSPKAKSLYEKKVILLVAQGMLVLIDHKSGGSVSVVQQIPIDNVHQIAVGLSLQYFRIELTDGSSYCLITRDKELSNVVINAIRNECEKLVHGKLGSHNFLEILNKDLSVLRHIETEVFDGHSFSVRLYCFVQQKETEFQEFEHTFNSPLLPVDNL
eukprot:268975_1